MALCSMIYHIQPHAQEHSLHSLLVLYTIMSLGFPVNLMVSFLYCMDEKCVDPEQQVANLIAEPGVKSLILPWCHTSMEINCEIFSMVILLFLLIQEGWLSVTSESNQNMCTKYWLTAQSSLPRKKCG